MLCSVGQVMNDKNKFQVTLPAKYSGVAPIGIGESYTFRPTLDQDASGSKLTPRLSKEAAKSLRRAFRVLTRMTSGRALSDASINSNASDGPK